MTLQSPAVGILWENWRVTRVEVAWRLASGLVAAFAVLTLTAVLTANEAFESFSAAVAFLILVAPNLTGWLSYWKLNGGRPGFPFHLLYTRPVRTAMLVGVPMAYRAVVPAASYLVSAVLLRATFGHPFPLLPVAAWIATLHAVLSAVTWWTRNRVVHVIGMLVTAMVWSGRGMDALTGGIDFHDSTKVWPALFHIPLSGYAVMGVIGLASFGLTVPAVERQRHGDGGASIRWSGVGFPDPLITLFRFPCPATSATRAQVWFELRSRGLPLLAIGAAFAMVNLLLQLVSGPIDALLTNEFRSYVDCRRGECFHARPLAMMFAVMSVPVVLALGGNAFGILARQGRVYASPFEAIQPYGTGRFAVLKLLVRSVCVVAALAVVVVSVWAPGSFADAGRIFGNPLQGVQSALQGAAGALTAYELTALAVVGFIAVCVMLAARASLVALWTCYPWHLNTAGAVLLLYGTALPFLALNDVSLGPILRATSWAVALAILCATAYLAWRTFAERLLTLYEACGIVLLSAMFAAAWLTLLRAAGVTVTGMAAADAVRMLSPALLPITIGVLAPWSYSRVRHT